MKTAIRHIEIKPCSKRLALQARGLYGFHDSPSCPNCAKIDAGFTVHAGDSLFSPLVGYYPDKETIISETPAYFTR